MPRRKRRQGRRRPQGRQSKSLSSLVGQSIIGQSVNCPVASPQQPSPGRTSPEASKALRSAAGRGWAPDPHAYKMLHVKRDYSKSGATTGYAATRAPRPLYFKFLARRRLTPHKHQPPHDPGLGTHRALAVTEAVGNARQAGERGMIATCAATAAAHVHGGLWERWAEGGASHSSLALLPMRLQNGSGTWGQAAAAQYEVAERADSRCRARACLSSKSTYIGHIILRHQARRLRGIGGT